MQVNPLGCLSGHYYRNYYMALPSRGCRQLYDMQADPGREL